MKFKNEPAAYAALARIAVMALAIFGINLDPVTAGGIYVAVEGITTVVTRQSVTPNSKL